MTNEKETVEFIYTRPSGKQSSIRVSQWNNNPSFVVYVGDNITGYGYSSISEALEHLIKDSPDWKIKGIKITHVKETVYG